MISPAQSVQLIGASGSNAASINGIFDPTSPPEFHDGHLTYRKRGDQDKWLEYHGALKRWLVKATVQKGTENGWAWIGSKLRVDQCLSGMQLPLTTATFLSSPRSFISRCAQLTGVFTTKKNGRSSLPVTW
jgi:hypothetical protein